MESNPLVTIVTPCLNSGAYIRRTIESVLSQDYDRIEYIVMDGGSSDSTRAILDQYSGRLAYDSGPDAGTADAINMAFERAKGTVFGWLNADDTYSPGAVRSAVQWLRERPEIDVLYGNA